ncbi:hypothetical protein MAR_024817 [Mya arenaria]|uniref:Uncharacterized protein n=1 Tax=Mya arenaria TaxID=6604 RepID=A0ABY7DUY5_MYAAR|nr:hypothetical protein MAR_024817 [Mya arenaria]
MEKGGTPKKDESISDILAAADRKTQQNGYAESSKNTHETGDSARNTQEDNRYSRETDLVNGSIRHNTDRENLPVTDEVKLQSEQDTTLSSGTDKRKPSISQSDGDTMNVNEVYEGQLDLSNPDSVIHMLENCDLTEEDTENLLQEAYSMNRKLKEMLRRQDADQSASGKTKSQKPKPKNKPSQGSSAASSSSGSRVGSSFGSRKILPPIPGETRDGVTYKAEEGNGAKGRVE